jgi:spore maturation protein CgeB
MEILVVGYDTPGALERYCVKALRQEGHSATYYDVQAEFARYCRFHGTPVLSEVEQAVWRGRFNRGLIARVRHSHPDLVLVFKGIELSCRTLEDLRRLPGRPVLVNWNPDSPFDTTASNTSRQLVESIQLYDIYFIWDRDLFAPLREAGARRVEYLPFGYDPDVHHPVDLTAAEREQNRSQVCFIGGYTPHRAALLETLTGFDVKIWGPNWRWLPSRSPLRNVLQGGWTHGEEMSRAFSAADIVLNFIRPQNGQAHNMRTFEAPATGSLMLSTRTRDQLGWLPEGRAAAYFDTPAGLAEQTAYYLANPVRRSKVAAEGHRIVTTGGHTYADRMRELIAAVRSL